MSSKSKKTSTQLVVYAAPTPKKGGGGKGKQTNGSQKKTKVVDAGASRVNSHVKMVVDPCTAVLGHTGYRGNDGFVQRFTTTTTRTTAATATAFVYIFHPAYNSSYYTEVATAGTGFTPTATPIAGPGQTFLLASASTMRPVASCLSISYLGTELNRQGIIYMGLLKASVLGGGHTVGTLQALLGTSVRTPDHNLECKWLPSPSDESYWETGSVAPDDNGDRNVIVIAGSGFTNGIDVALKTTLITEWQPKSNLGFQATTPSSPDPPAGLEHVRTKLVAYGNFWNDAAHTAATAITTARKAYRVGKSAMQMAAMAA